MGEKFLAIQQQRQTKTSQLFYTVSLNFVWSVIISWFVNDKHTTSYHVNSLFIASWNGEELNLAIDFLSHRYDREWDKSVLSLKYKKTHVIGTTRTILYELFG